MPPLWLRLVQRGKAKPDYDLITKLEYELGIGEIQDVAMAALERAEYHNSYGNWRSAQDMVAVSAGAMQRMIEPTKELGVINALVGSSYQRLIDDYTTNPRWWEIKPDE